MAKRAVVAMGGGPTRVINQTLFGIVDECDRRGIEVLGARHGLDGVLGEDFIELSPSAPPVSTHAGWPGAMIGSTRRKPSVEDCARAFDIFKRHAVHYFFYIGGNDTSEACAIINSNAEGGGYELRTFHVPKTVDNDLVMNDHTPGFGSAARFVAHCILGDDMDSQSLLGIKIDVIMGRNAGWLTAASALARGEEGDAPHLIYVCERNKSAAQIAGDVVELYEARKRGVIAISEGLNGPDGEPFLNSPAIREELSGGPYAAVVEFLEASEKMLAASGGKPDGYGHMQLSGTGMLADALAALAKIAIIKECGVGSPRVRADTLGYAQRAFAGEVSPVDAQEAEMVGRDAVRYADQGDIDGSITLRADRHGGKYRAYTQIAKLQDIGGKTRKLEKAFIAENGKDVTPAFLDYGLPIVGPMQRGK